MVKGKIYYSPYTGYEYIVRGRRDIFTDGVKTDEVRELKAEFAVHRGEYTYEDSDGNTQVAPDISGHYFDVNAQAEQKGWDEKEVELVVKRLDRACIDFPSEISLYSAPRVLKPWPKYDETAWSKIADLADNLGLVHEALGYERENENRAGVIDALTKILEAEQAEAELTAA